MEGDAGGLRLDAGISRRLLCAVAGAAGHAARPGQEAERHHQAAPGEVSRGHRGASVDRGMLMAYNLLPPDQTGERSSILDNAELGAYLASLKTYPLPLDS